MSEVKKTYASLVNPNWKIKNNSMISSLVRKSLSHRDNSSEKYKNTQDDRINNYYNQTLEITVDGKKKLYKF
jgi:hypothetical protein